MGLKEWLMLVVLSALWGGSFFFVEIVIPEFPPLTLVFSRVAFAAIGLWLFILIKGLPIPKKIEIWRAFFMMGILNNVIPFTLIVWGQTHIASGLASIFNATTPLFTVIVAGIFLSDEKPNALKILGVAIGFVGVVIMIGPSALGGLDSNAFAQFAILAAALSYGFAGVYGRRFRAMDLHPVISAAGQVTASSIILIPIVILVDQPFSLSMPSTQAILAVFALAILSTAIAYTLYFQLLSSAGATNLLLVTFLIPVSAILLGTLVLNESLELIHLLGMSLIAIGLSAIDGRLWRFGGLAKG